eukprot:symbB.v1.2.035697.t1/scaffold4868.1/size33687/3
MLIAPLAVGLDKSDGDRDCDVALAKTPGGHSAIFINPHFAIPDFERNWVLDLRCRLFVEDLGASFTKKQANNAGGYGSGTRSADDIDVTGRTSRMHSGGGAANRFIPPGDRSRVDQLLQRLQQGASIG